MAKRRLAPAPLSAPRTLPPASATPLLPFAMFSILPTPEEDVWKDQVNLAGHCAICLKRFHPEDLESLDTNNDLSATWTFLLEKLHSEFAHKCITFVTFNRGADINGTPASTSYPPFCNICIDGIATLKQLRQKLMDVQKNLGLQVSRLREIAKISRENGNYLEFEKSLQRAALPTICIKNTTEFFNKIHGAATEDTGTSKSTADKPLNRGRQRNQSGSSSHHIKLSVRETTASILVPPTPPSPVAMDSYNDNDSDNCNGTVKSEVLSESDNDSIQDADWMKTEAESEGEKEAELPKVQFPIAPASGTLFLVKFPLQCPTPGSGKIRQIKKKTRRCSICYGKIPLAEMLSHMQSHVKDYAVLCPGSNCGIVFSCQAHLERDSKHVANKCSSLVETLNREKSCGTCDFKTNSKLLLRYHHLRHETAAEKKFPCPIENCQEKFTLRVNVEYHLYSNHLYDKKNGQTDSQKCPLCFKNIKLSELEGHYRENHKSTEILNCWICSISLPDRPTLYDHMTVHKESWAEGIHCDICEAAGIPINTNKFFRPHRLYEHYFKVHKIGQKLLCDQCDHSCFTRKVLQGHKVKEHPRSGSKSLEKKVYTCNVCDPPKEFKTRCYLTKHSIEFHGAAPFTCQVCSKAFSSSSKLSFHKKSVHLGIRKQHACSLCPSIFPTPSALQQHETDEHQKRSFKCWKCRETFADSDRLKQHRRERHKKEVVCEECGQKVGGPRQLREHMLIHTGERPLTCDLCGSKFRQKSSLYNHQKTHKRQGDQFTQKPTFDRNVKRRKF